MAGVLFLNSFCGDPIFPESVVEENIFYIFSRDLFYLLYQRLNVDAWIDFWGLCSSLLTSVSISVLVPGCFDYNHPAV